MSDFDISPAVASVVPSATLAMTGRAQAMRRQGIDVLSMSAGEPDFDTPDHIKDAAKRALDAGQTKYTPVAGTPELRAAVVQLAHTLYGWEVDPGQTTVSTGGKQVLFNAMAALLRPGDEALFASPYWVSYPEVIRYTGATPVPVVCDEAQGFLPKAADWEKQITGRTRLLILNSPSNPTGATYTAAELRAIGEMLAAHPQVFVITDDIYYGLVYDAPFVSLAQLAPQLRPRMLIASGVSKTYAMTGWRIGFGIGPKKLIDAMNNLQGAATSGACSIAQAAATAALLGPQAPVESMRQRFAARRDRLVAGLRQIDGLSLLAPAGAFYVFPRIDAFFTPKRPDSEALCEDLLSRAHLALVPGSAFGSGAHVRLSFACSEAQIDAAVGRLQEGLKGI
jgi:aspartate aminotransferase